MKMFKLAADCIPCPDGCGEPWCSDCGMHYADCGCPGPFTKENMSETLVVVSKVKAIAKAQDVRTSEEYIDVISELVQKKTETAIAAALAAGRKTLKAEDLT